MPTQWGFQTSDDRRAEAVRLQEIRQIINEAVEQILNEFIEATWAKDTYSVDKHPIEVEWYLAGANTGPHDSPVEITLTVDDTDLFADDNDRTPMLLISINSEALRYAPRNARVLPIVLGRATALQVIAIP